MDTSLVCFVPFLEGCSHSRRPQAVYLELSATANDPPFVLKDRDTATSKCNPRGQTHTFMLETNPIFLPPN